MILQLLTRSLEQFPIIVLSSVRKVSSWRMRSSMSASRALAISSTLAQDWRGLSRSERSA
jgi:hypothetical protein